MFYMHASVIHNSERGKPLKIMLTLCRALDKYNVINIVKRHVLTHSDTRITVRVMMCKCNAVNEINVVSE
jgi:hypothetical protein